MILGLALLSYKKATLVILPEQSTSWKQTFKYMRLFVSFSLIPPQHDLPTPKGNNRKEDASSRSPVRVSHNMGNIKSQGNKIIFLGCMFHCIDKLVQGLDPQGARKLNPHEFCIVALLSWRFLFLSLAGFAQTLIKIKLSKYKTIV